tara:strand:- start:9886 stop:10035 length:150 start_codon:yes stop_codon:yes gene_type:complete
MRIARHNGKVYAFMVYDGVPLLAEGETFGEAMSDIYRLIVSMVFEEVVK